MNETAHAEGTEIDLGRLIFVLLKKSWILLLAAVFSAGITLMGTFYFVTPQYRSSVMLYVNNAQAVENLVDSFSVIVKMRGSLMEVIKYTQIDSNHEALRKQITVSAVENTDFVQITVASPDPYEAEKVANAIGQILPEKIENIMEGTSAKVVDEAVLAAGPSSPSYPNNALLGFLIGLLLSMGIVLLQELFAGKEKIRSQ